MGLTSRKQFVTLARTSSAGSVEANSRLDDLKCESEVETPGKLYEFQKLEFEKKSREE